jgi:hypothetical protein
MFLDTHKPKQAWKAQNYPVPAPTRRGLRLKASALRTIHSWHGTSVSGHPATVMVPALYNMMPAESVALGWLNEIDSLVPIRQRMVSATKVTGWDAFTFHTIHNADHFFDTAISAMRETWVKEGRLTPSSIQEAKRRFGKPYGYHNIQARLVENLVFQSSLMDWVGRHASDVPLRFHVIGTSLLSALVSAHSITFEAAVESATKFGTCWNETLRKSCAGRTDDEIGWNAFHQVRQLMEGQALLSMGVSREDLPSPDAPAQPFWYSPTASDEPTLITTAQEAANALETLNLSSWFNVPAKASPNVDEPIRGWLVSPLHPMARLCRWSVSNYLLATPDSVNLFLDTIAPLGRQPLVAPTVEPLQNRLRLSRMKVTGP